jgi:hypothetical protein
MDLRWLRGDGSKQLRQLVPGTAHFLLGRAFRRLYAAVAGKTKKDARRSNGFPPPAPPGNRGRSSAIPARPSGAAPEGPGTSRFTKPLELKKPGAPAAREWRRWCSSTPQNHRPGQLAAHIALGVITWGGLVGGRPGATGRANCAC